MRELIDELSSRGFPSLCTLRLNSVPGLHFPSDREIKEKRSTAIRTAVHIKKRSCNKLDGQSPVTFFLSKVAYDQL